MSSKKTIVILIIGLAGAVLGLFGVDAFNSMLLMQLSLPVRMAAMIAVHWLIALVPFIIMRVVKDKPKDYGFTKTKVTYQILTGIIIGLAMSVVLTLLPCILGKAEWIDNGHHYKYFWQFAYEFIYAIIAVGLTEEFVFRGFIYSKVKSISNSEITPIVVSSICFGAFHLLGGGIIQMFTTACIGALLCVCRLKIKHCSTLSLIIAHGIHDALITVWIFQL